LSNDCVCKPEDVMLLPCSGGSNCGQIANQAAISLDTQGVGKAYCLAGIGAHIPNMLEKAKSAQRIVAIDGCQVACAKKMVEHAGLKLTDYVVVTDEGITKSHTFDIKQVDINTINQKVKASLAKKPSVSL
jgi:uncharacterized metal-binding protein